MEIDCFQSEGYSFRAGFRVNYIVYVYKIFNVKRYSAHCVGVVMIIKYIDL